jgi:hypothetical protein
MFATNPTAVRTLTTLVGEYRRDSGRRVCSERGETLQVPHGLEAAAELLVDFGLAGL